MTDTVTSGRAGHNGLATGHVFREKDGIASRRITCFGANHPMKRIALLVVLGALTIGCSGDDKDSPASGALEAPMLMKVMPMEGALHLEWMNMTKDCDSVEAERMMDGEDYKQVFTVPGTVDNKMDAGATDDMDYMYRLRCKKGSTYSDYSNEMSGNPKK